MRNLVVCVPKQKQILVYRIILIRIYTRAIVVDNRHMQSKSYIPLHINS